MSDQQAESNEESISRQFWIPFAKTKYFSSVAPDPTAVEWLDGELDALAEVTRLVKRRRNDCAHVSRLPQEVLVRIFRAMERPQRRMLYYSRFSYDLGWMLVTHVCQYWREVALDNSSLWSTLRCADVSPAWGTEIMKRSKQAPLNVEVSTASDRSSTRQPSIKDILEEIMTSHSHHLRNLKLVGAGLVEHFSPLCHPKALPDLEVLAIEGDERSPQTFSLSLKSLPKAAPKLKELHLARIPISGIPTRPFPNLTTLSLNFEKDEALSFKQLKGLLDRTPALEQLCLDGAFPADLPESGTGAIFELPSSIKLIQSTVKLRAHMAPWLQLHDLIKAPTARCSMIFETDLSLESLETIMRRQDPFHFPAVEISCDSEGAFALHFRRLPPQGPGATDVNAPVPMPEPILSIAARGRADFNTLIGAMPEWHSVSVLTYHDGRTSYMRDGAQARWLTIAKLATQVRRLRIKGSGTIVCFLRLLTDFHDGSEKYPDIYDASQPSRVHIFPGLASLTFLDDGSPAFAKTLARTEERLLAALALRRIYGNPIPELNLPLNAIPPALLERLRNEVLAIGAAEYDRF